MNVAPMIKTFHNMKRFLLLGLDVNALNERIKQARERAGFSVNKAAEKLGLKRVQIWRMENRDFALSAERLFELSENYGVDPRTLFKGINDDLKSDNRFERIGEAVRMVEEIVQSCNVRPSPDLVREAVIEVLKQDFAQPAQALEQPFEPDRYQGLVTLIFKKDN